MKIKQLQETTAGAVASVAMPIGKTHKRTEEAANPAQQAAIAIAMKKAGKKPKNVEEGFSKDEIEAAMKDFVKSGGEIVQGKKSKGPRKPGLSLASKHIGGSGDKMRPSRTGRGSNPMGKAVVAVENNIDIPEIPREPRRREEQKPNPKMNEYMDTDQGATPPKTPIEKPMDTKPAEEPKDKKDPRTYMDKAKSVTKESSILKGMSEAHISEEELLLSPGQGVRFKTELMPKRTDHEVEMARNQLRVAAQSAKRIYQNIKDLSEIQGLDGWVQAKITKASDYLDAVNNYIEGKKQMLEIQDEVDEQVDTIDQRLTAQYNTPQMKAQSQAIDQAFASGDEREFQRLGIQSPQQIERDYQTMLAKEPAQDAALMRNPKLTPSARPAQRYNPKGIPIREMDIEEAHKLSAHEKFKRGLKRAGYDPDAGAKRLLDLIARQAEERKEREKEFARRDAEFYGKRKDIDEGGLNEYAPNGGDDNYDRKIYFAVQESDEHYSTYALNPNTIDTDELKVRFGKKLWAKGPFMDLNDAHEAIWAHIEKNKDVTEDWQKTNRRDKTSGMSRKAVKQYRRENPGSKLQTAVTTKPSKLKKGSKSAKRRKSFCSRMRGMKKSRTSAKTARDPNSNINKALRRWNCESVEEMRNLVMLAEQKIAMLKEEQGLEENLHKWFKEKWVRFGPDGKIRGDCARGDDSEGKPKCLPQSKAQSLGKKGRASAAARKRREDPNPERSGPAINVNTKKKSNEGVAEGHELCPECGGAMYSEEMINEKKDACYYKVKSRYKVWPSAYASGALVKCRNKGAKNWGNKSK